MTKNTRRQEPEESVQAAWNQAQKNDPDFLDNFEVIPRTKTEQELADYYQAHKEDPDLWGEPVPAPRTFRGHPSQGMGARISVRFTPEEMAGVRAQAVAEGITYSEVVRRAINAECKQARE